MWNICITAHVHVVLKHYFCDLIKGLFYENSDTYFSNSYFIHQVYLKETMTLLMFGYLILISVAFYISPFFVFGKIHQTHDSV